MKIYNILIASTALALPMSAHAVTLVTGGPLSTALTLTAAGLTGYASLTGGSVLAASQGTAAMPAGTSGLFLSAGPDTGNVATLTFSPNNIGKFAFLWGSPDTYNKLTITTSAGSTDWDASSAGVAPADGNQAFAQYVTFALGAGETLNSLTFTTSPAQDAFEVANFSVAAVPEPASWALMISGFGLVGGALRRREQTRVTFAV